ncbi:MAG: hypothetical protein JOZ18_02735 [Chloroflexi bacterium]|nr:hypothetical protein [Chloroflexota bacterium]
MQQVQHLASQPPPEANSPLFAGCANSLQQVQRFVVFIKKNCNIATKWPSTLTWSRFTNVAVAKIATNCNILQQFSSSSSIQQYCWNFTLPPEKTVTL